MDTCNTKICQPLLLSEATGNCKKPQFIRIPEAEMTLSQNEPPADDIIGQCSLAPWSATKILEEYVKDVGLDPLVTSVTEEFSSHEV